LKRVSWYDDFSFGFFSAFQGFCHYYWDGTELYYPKKVLKPTEAQSRIAPFFQRIGGFSLADDVWDSAFICFCHFGAGTSLTVNAFRFLSRAGRPVYC